jgi:hypothetical protein
LLKFLFDPIIKLKIMLDLSNTHTTSAQREHYTHKYTEIERLKKTIILLDSFLELTSKFHIYRKNLRQQEEKMAKITLLSASVIQATANKVTIERAELTQSDLKLLPLGASLPQTQIIRRSRLVHPTVENVTFSDTRFLHPSRVGS